MAQISDLVSFSYEAGRKILEGKTTELIKEQGQFLTPPPVARYMARQLGAVQQGAHLLEPAVGSGVLICAVIERLIAEGQPLELWAEAYETDAELCRCTKNVLQEASQKAKIAGVTIHWQIYQEDFVLNCLPESQPSLFGETSNRIKSFDFVLSNPPYFKLDREDPRVRAVSGKVKGHTNIYTLFMAISAQLMKPKGRACFIVPRSFCSGAYFAAFRRDLLRQTTPLAIHLFQSRQDVFKESNVLQENVVFTFERNPVQPTGSPYWVGYIQLSTSRNDSDLSGVLPQRQVAYRHFLNPHDPNFSFRLPTGLLDEQLLDAMDKWDGSLEKFGWQISTGPVVPFRARVSLRESVEQANDSTPLLWMQHIKPHHVVWPLESLDKPQAIQSDQDDLLIPNTNYVLLRRFSAKEDRRRLVAAPFLAQDFPYRFIGLENHLNYIYRKKGEMLPSEIYGLSAILNSALVDRYFRIINGNTQVNAAEIRALPLPPLEVICRIGENEHTQSRISPDVLDQIVFRTLWETQLLSDDFPMIQETRITMGKIEQAQEILETLGLPPGQQNEIAALTLLILAQLSDDAPWTEAKGRSLRVHDILAEIKQRYGRSYAENTRETIRRQVLHQFEQAGIVIRNPDEPALATNSPRTNYILSEALLAAIRTYETHNWEQQYRRFLGLRGALLEIYQKTREQNKVPLRVMDGTIYKLSPGRHNQLQALIVEEFGPRFAPGSKLLYLGDTTSKTLIFERNIFAQLNVVVSDHGKLPDIVLYEESKKWLFLIEAVTSHGPVSPKRQVELEELFAQCPFNRIYISAFPDFVTFKRFVDGIAWETEVWIAEMPSHLIHFNGDKFLGPRP
jgi:adenine-specific DNA-methyltransferase